MRWWECGRSHAGESSLNSSCIPEKAKEMGWIRQPPVFSTAFSFLSSDTFHANTHERWTHSNRMIMYYGLVGWVRQLVAQVFFLSSVNAMKKLFKTLKWEGIFSPYCEHDHCSLSQSHTFFMLNAYSFTAGNSPKQYSRHLSKNIHAFSRNEVRP